MTDAEDLLDYLINALPLGATAVEIQAHFGWTYPRLSVVLKHCRNLASEHKLYIPRCRPNDDGEWRYQVKDRWDPTSAKSERMAMTDVLSRASSIRLVLDVCKQRHPVGSQQRLEIDTMLTYNDAMAISAESFISRIDEPPVKPKRVRRKPTASTN